MTELIETIWDAIVDKITNDADKIQVVYFGDRSTLEGVPAATVQMSTQEAGWGSTATDKLTFVFEVRVYYDITKESETETANRALAKAVGQLLGIFKVRSVLGTACDFVEPVPMRWEFEERGEKVYAVAPLTLRCVKHT